MDDVPSSSEPSVTAALRAFGVWFLAGCLAGAALYLVNRDTLGGEGIVYIVTGVVFGVVGGSAYVILRLLINTQPRTSPALSMIAGLASAGVVVLTSCLWEWLRDKQLNGHPDLVLDAVLLLAGLLLGGVVGAVSRRR